MKTMKQLYITILLATFMITLTACSAKVGSDEWCANMKQKPSGDWSSNQATDFAKHCLLR
jgi:hypothetical protein